MHTDTHRDACDMCGEAHDPYECCECGAGVGESRRFPYLCADHATEAWEGYRADQQERGDRS